jgi:beta-lactamase regulating signal transducer with metallopeptidase domain
MINSYSIWLLQASLGIGMLAVVYELLLRKLTFFNLNRLLLIAGLIFCLIIPLISLPSLAGLFNQEAVSRYQLIINPYQLVQIDTDLSADSNYDHSVQTDILSIAGILLLSVYIAGAIRKTVMLLSALRSVLQLRQNSRLIAHEGKIRIYLQNKLPTFSFANSIFLHEDIEQLNEHEKQYVLLHEKTHIRQKHTLDILLYESTGIVFWFHPAITYLSDALKELHEYLVDSHIASQEKPVSQYGLLLVKLASQKSRGPGVVNSFSNTSTLKRIEMLTKPKSRSMQKLKFLSVLPIMGSIVALSSFMTQPKTALQTAKPGMVQKNSDQKANLKIAKITWVGNTKYTSSELNKVLGIKVGDRYDSLLLENRLTNMKSDDIASLYMDQGHLFFRTDVTTSVTGDQISIKLEMYEGQKARIGKVIIKGNKKVSEQTILNLIDIKPGGYFNRTKLVIAQRSLSESGKFVSDNIIINPIPDQQSFDTDNERIVDFEFTVTEL